MISPSEADKTLHNHCLYFSTRTCSLAEAQGEVLAEDCVADRPFPPYNRVQMDGYAFRFQDVHPVDPLKVQGVQYAGEDQGEALKPREARKIMTGAILPEGADTVSPREDCEVDKRGNLRFVHKPQQGQFISHKGSEEAQGSILFPAKTKIEAPEIAVLATVGKTAVRVVQKPRIAILSTGDELVLIHEKPLPYQIRQSNGVMLQELFKPYASSISVLHLPDEPEVMKEKIRLLLEENEVLVFSGGVSMGDKDYVPQILKQLDVKAHFHRVKQKPGKPLWFGTRAGKNAVFGLPGNPVSSLVCGVRYVKPWLQAALGQRPSETSTAILTEEVNFSKQLTYFLTVKISYRFGHLLATPVPMKSSGDLAHLTRGDGVLELPAHLHSFKKGENYPFYAFRTLSF